MNHQTVSTTLQVRYAETDAMGLVYHANYLVYFEVGRGAYLQAIGLDYNALEREGYFVVVAEAKARYLAPARYGDTLRIDTQLASVGARSFLVRYRVWRDEQEIASGETAHVCVDRSGKACQMPKAYWHLLSGDATA